MRNLLFDVTALQRQLLEEKSKYYNIHRLGKYQLLAHIFDINEESIATIKSEARTYYSNCDL